MRYEVKLAVQMAEQE
jgi:hypothetical protein